MASCAPKGYICDMFDIPSMIQRMVLLLPPVLMAVTFHEMAHGWMAARLGDPTARMLGRLTFNPFKHLDPMGTLVFFLTQAIGWAKPVPVNPSYFDDPRRDMMWVAFAGPGANLLLAAVLAIVLRGIGEAPAFFQGGLGYFGAPMIYMAYLSVKINIGLAVFNLLPIPPLDGSRIIAGILPPGMARGLAGLEKYGFVIVLLLVFTGVTDRIIVPVVHYLDDFFLGN